jgi:cation:H+ antiporter
LSAVGIYFGADHTVSSITDIATRLALPPSLIALTVLSLGTTLPELAVNISAIKQGKAEMAVGNVLGSCIFNTLAIPFAAASVGTVNVPESLLAFSLPVMLGSGLFFYLLTLDKRISRWEGWLFAGLYALFLLQLVRAV